MESCLLLLQIMASDTVGGRPVLPFAATYCQSPPMPCYANGSYPVEPWAVEMLLTMPYEEGAAGVVVCKLCTYPSDHITRQLSATQFRTLFADHFNV